MKAVKIAVSHCSFVRLRYVQIIKITEKKIKKITARYIVQTLFYNGVLNVHTLNKSKPDEKVKVFPSPPLFSTLPLYKKLLQLQQERPSVEKAIYLKYYILYLLCIYILFIEETSLSPPQINPLIIVFNLKLLFFLHTISRISLETRLRCQSFPICCTNCLLKY